MKLFFYFFIGCFSLAGLARAEDMTCPASITADQKLTKDVPGWGSLSSAMSHRFQHLSIFSGHPQQHASLVPDDPDNLERVKWTLPRASEDYWVGCHYFGTSVMLAKEVNRKATTCVAIFKVNPSSPQDRQLKLIECK